MSSAEENEKFLEKIWTENVLLEKEVTRELKMIDVLYKCELSVLICMWIKFQYPITN
jgi:hypothetical protein